MINLPAYMQPDLRRSKFRDRVFQCVADFQAKHGRSPHQKEIAAEVGISTVSSVWRALKILEAEGRIERRHRTEIKLAAVMPIAAAPSVDVTTMEIHS